MGDAGQSDGFLSPKLNVPKKFLLPLSALTAIPHTEFCIRLIWGCFPWLGLSLLAPNMENVSASECNYILYNVLSNLCQFGEPPFLFQHDNASVHQVSSIKNVSFPVCCERT